MTLPGMTEHDHQAMIVKWLRAHGHECFAVPNEQGGSGQYRRASWLRAQGKLKGAPDLVVMELAPVVGVKSEDKPQNWAPVAIETKKPKGPAAEEHQRKVHKRMRAAGWIVLTPKGYDDAVAQLKGLGF